MKSVHHRSERSLSDTLSMLNLTHEPSGKTNGKRRIRNAAGEPMFVGDCWQVWEWLVETDRLKGFDLKETGS